MPLAWRGVGGDQNPLGNVESLDRAPVSIAFAINPDLTVVVNACFELHPDSASSVATDRIWDCHVDPIPNEAEPVGQPLREVVAFLPIGIIVLGLASWTTFSLSNQSVVWLTRRLGPGDFPSSSPP